MAFIDTHCHLDFTDDKDGWIDRAKEAGVGKIVNVGTSVEGSRKSVEIAEKYSRHRSRNEFGMTGPGDFEIYASVGIHPQDGQKDIEKFGSLEKCIDKLRKIAQSSGKVVAVGEIGLDYYLKTTDPSTSSGQAAKQLTTDKEKGVQRKLFVGQIKLAQELNSPILVHCRNAWDEIFELISGAQDSHPEFISGSKKKIPKQVRNDSGNGSGNDRGENGKFSTLRQAQGSKNNIKGLFHSWTGDWEAAQKALGLGFYISFSGIVTFKNAQLVQEVARKVPIDRMLIETDSPFLTPEPHRGKTNEPKNVIIVGKFLASIRNQPADLIASQTTANAERLFGLK